MNSCSLIVLTWLFLIHVYDAAVEQKDIYIPSQCDSVAKPGDHLLISYSFTFANGSTGPHSVPYSQPLHMILAEHSSNGAVLNSLVKGMCQNATRQLTWDNIAGVNLSPIVEGGGSKLFKLEESITLDLKLLHITEQADYHIFDALRHENISQVLDLIDEHKGINSKDEYGQTALMIAVSRQYASVVAALLNARRPKVDVNLSKESGFTALFYAVEKGTPSILQALLRRGADPNAQVMQEGSRGNTPLHIACLLEKVKHAELLLEYGAQPFVYNQHGQTPLSMLPSDAVRSTKIYFKKIFEEAGARLTAGESKTASSSSEL